MSFGDLAATSYHSSRVDSVFEFEGGEVEDIVQAKNSGDYLGTHIFLGLREVLCVVTN